MIASSSSSPVPVAAAAAHLRRMSPLSVRRHLIVVSLLSVLLWTQLTGVAAAASTRPVCGPGEYRMLQGGALPAGTDSTAAGNELTTACVRCSVCPVNQIVRRPCSRLSDTVCGPLYDFEFLNIQRQTAVASRIVQQRLMMATTAPVGQRAAAEADDMDSITGTGGKDDVIRQCSDDTWWMFYFVIATVLVVIVTVLSVVCFAVMTGRLRGFFVGRKVSRLHSQDDPFIGAPEVISVGHVGDDGAVSVQTAVVVDRRVSHLETQLHRNRIRQLWANFGSGAWRLGSTGAGIYVSGNEYVDERSRLRMMHAGSDSPATADAAAAAAAAVDDDEDLQTSPLAGYALPPSTTTSQWHSVGGATV